MLDRRASFFFFTRHGHEELGIGGGFLDPENVTRPTINRPEHERTLCNKATDLASDKPN